MKIVFDTNVLLSMFVFADSRFAPLRAEVDAGRWLAYTRPDCLEEFRRVLAYDMFELDAARQQEAHSAYVAVAKQAVPPPHQIALPRCKDKDDQKFLELARDAGADWLVTSDKDLLRLARKVANHFRIIQPEQALKLIFATEQAAG